MKFSIKDNKIKYALCIVLALIIATVFEITVFMRETEVKFEGKAVSVMDEDEYSFTYGDYIVTDNRYTRAGIDPSIRISDIDREISSVMVSFSKPIYSNPRLQLFFAKEDEELSEKNSCVIENIPLMALNVIVDIPKADYDTIRIDIDGSFSLEDIIVSDRSISSSNQFSLELFGFFRLLTTFLILSSLFVCFVFWMQSKKSERSLKMKELLFCIGCFAFYFLWAIAKAHDYAPDEEMRHDVTEFLFNNNRLPIGDELLSNWGFSYAHIPTVLCNLLGSLFMKIASIYTNDSHSLLLASRMVSVCCATGTVYFVIKTSKLIFSSCARWIFVCFVAFMPQFAFLASYSNNDIVALFGISIIIYSWVFALKYNWNYKSGVILSAGVIVCALSYYNSYAWVLFSVFLFIITYFIQNKKDYKGFIKLSAFIIGLVVLFASYNFIRHLIVYGDLLGFETIEQYGEKFAVESLKPSNRWHLSENGVSLMSMLFAPEYKWVLTTWNSFIGVFGYMQYYCPAVVYDYMKVFIAVGGIAFVLRGLYEIVIKRKKPDLSKTIFLVCVVMSAVVTVALSVYNSYVMDFQPQGRYCYPAFLALAIIIAKGYEWLVKLLKYKEHQYAVTSCVCTVSALISLYVFYNIYLPS
ncbi:MAG: hypothetical protein E7562_02995 [Ruminococcaceae bacterium]|nr:hypothetical protein [Oscillospiraceae bacterium]